MIYFTADTHFGHTNIIRFSNRPFSTIQEMDETIINNWNNYIKPNDIVWHLGDFSWKSPYYYAKRLNGKINLILGNHDFKKISIGDYNLFKSVSTLYEFKIEYNVSITLCHFAMRVWNKSHFNSYHLYGHSHGSLPGIGKSMDVGVDTNNFKPYSLDEILVKMKSLPDNFNLVKNIYEN